MKNRTLSIVGDGGFWHNGFTSGVVNAVYNVQDSVLVILEKRLYVGDGNAGYPVVVVAVAVATSLQAGHPRHCKGLAPIRREVGQNGDEPSRLGHGGDPRRRDDNVPGRAESDHRRRWMPTGTPAPNQARR